MRINSKLLFLAICLLPSTAKANVVWPELIISSHYLASIGLISLGLLIEWPFIKWITNLTWLRALIPLFICNLVSMSIGQLIVIFGGLFFQLILQLIYDVISPDIGTFNTFGWIAAGFFTALVTAFFEWLALILIPRFNVQASLKSFTLLLLANILSVGVTLMHLRIYGE